EPAPRSAMSVKRQRQCHAGWHRSRDSTSSSVSSQVLLFALCSEVGGLRSNDRERRRLILMYSFDELIRFQIAACVSMRLDRTLLADGLGTSAFWPWNRSVDENEHFQS